MVKRNMLLFSRGIQLIYITLLLLFITIETSIEKGDFLYWIAHFAPVGVVLIPYLISFKQPKTAGWLNLLLVVVYFVKSAGVFHWSTYLFICGPLVISGIFFIRTVNTN